MAEKGPSEDYWRAIEDAAKHHASSKTFSGKFLKRYLGDIGRIIERHDCKTVLDYGCGKGAIYNELDLEAGWGVKITKYDPAVPEFNKEPVGKFDLVICTHVVGCIPLHDLEWFIQRMYGYANKAVFVAERVGRCQDGKQWTKAVKEREGDWTAIQWLDELVPLRLDGVKLYFKVAYPMPSGIVYGLFEDG